MVLGAHGCARSRRPEAIVISEGKAGVRANSNAVIAWTIVSSGLDAEAGWKAGLVVARANDRSAATA
jgi:hypothetical protein